MVKQSLGSIPGGREQTLEEEIKSHSRAAMRGQRWASDGDHRVLIATSGNTGKDEFPGDSVESDRKEPKK